MERLSSELENCLRDLVDREKRGEDVSEYIFEVQYGGDGTERDYNYQRELANLGYLVVHVDGVNATIEGLTGKGRSYFDDLDRIKAEKRKAIWSDRRFQIGLSVFTLLLSTLAGYIAGHF